MQDKKFTPREVALAVLKKAEDLYNASSLGKKAKASPKKAAPGEEPVDPDAEPDTDVDPTADPAPVKGHVKLGKFMDRMEAKRGEKS